jgi:hypothetical protein
MDYEERSSVLNNKNERDVELAREYCDEHESYYREDTCEPIWKKNGDLDIYLVEVHDSLKAREEFVKKRNKTTNHKPKKYKKK